MALPRWELARARTAAGGDDFDEWVTSSLFCAAGKREIHRGRYWLNVVADGAGLRRGMDEFRGLMSRYRYTAYLARVEYEKPLTTAADQLLFLAELIVDAGYAADPLPLFRGEILALTFPAVCPVTGEKTTYDFFPVAFCPGHGDPGDPLYDPSLATPFLAINTTSDTFAFATFVADTAERAFHLPPWAINEPAAVNALLEKCTGAWQKMSLNTIRNYGATSVNVARSVRLADDEATWLAPHRDPAFAEDIKETHRHEMPVQYASRLCDKWRAALFDGVPYTPGREGQSGGTPEIDAALEAV